VNEKEVNTLYQTSIGSDGKYFIEIATNVGKDIYYSKDKCTQ